MSEVVISKAKAPKVLIACLSDPTNGPRLRRMVNLCIELGASVDVLSPQPKEQLYGVTYISYFTYRFGKLSNLFQIIRKLAATIIQALFPSVRNKERIIGVGHGFQHLKPSLINHEYDLIIVEDLDLLPFAFSIKGAARILFDAREYYPRQRENNLFFNLFQGPYRYLFCQQYLQFCDAMITVSAGLAGEYNHVFQVDSDIIRSLPNTHKLTVKNCGNESIKLVHHGLANPNRKLGKMLDVFDKLDSRFSFDLYLTGSRFVVHQLKKRVKNNSRIRIMKPVSFDQIIPMLSNYDVGLFYVEPTTFNLRHCLPNKLFEFIQARLAVAIGPSPDMAQVVNHYDCGFVAPEFSVTAMAEMLNGLSICEINQAKKNSGAASSKLSFEEEKKKLVKILNSLISEH